MAPPPLLLDGVVQHYAWGDTTYLPALLGRPADGRPWAEWWLGTHPHGPSHVPGGELLEAVSGPLPFLLKVLAVAAPLSLQAHPDAEQAVDGHRRGVYPDDRAKPELLCALTEFEAFCGIRPVEATVALLEELGAGRVAELVATQGPDGVLRTLYRGELDPAPMIEACADSDRPEARWVRSLDERYPGDRSVAVTLLLNHVVLQPGQAIRLTAGNLHAYLRGAGVELMASSDNVVRGGLTAKHVNVEELLRIVDTSPLVDPVLEVDPGEPYPLPEARCALVPVVAGTEHVAHGHELAVCLDGTAHYLAPGTRYRPVAAAYLAVSTG